MQQHTSFFEWLFVRPERRWLPLGAALALALIPFAGLVLAGDPGGLVQSERWRGLLVAPALIVYIVAVTPSVERGWTRVYSSLRPVVVLSDVDYNQLLTSATILRRRNELFALGSGGVFGLLRVGYTIEGQPSWLDVHLLFSTAILFGTLIWVIYLTIARTQATAVILRQPLCIDPNEISSFLAIGEQALILALIFIGGTVLSLLFSALEPGVFSQLDFWLIYIPVVLAPLAVFFLAMRPTHRVLVDAKECQLKIVRGELLHASRRLLDQQAQTADGGTSISQQILALAALEHRLQLARTWPYNTTMLRTLFVSVLAPGALLLARKALEYL